MRSKKHALGPKHKKLFPQFAPPDNWRTSNFHIEVDNMSGFRIVQHKENPRAWKEIKERVRARDDHTCRYCGFRALKWQVVHHIDGNPQNNDPKNHETICPMCNMVLHAGLGCTVLKTVDLYKKSRYLQADVVRRTRFLRASGCADEEIIKKLGLKEPAPFEQDRTYLRRLTAFASHRLPAREDFMTKGLEYGYVEARRQLGLEQMASAPFFRRGQDAYRVLDVPAWG